MEVDCATGPAFFMPEKEIFSRPVCMKGRKLRICVIDGLGGGIGSILVKRLKEVYGEEYEVIALGTNVIATSQMLRAGANQGGSGENAIKRTTPTADVILGTVAIVLAHAMSGEVTPGIAAAVAASPGRKILLPLTQEEVEIVGVTREPLPHLVEIAITHRLPEVLKDV
jgi:hypothetical protein